jgi:hypothetical protein
MDLLDSLLDIVLASVTKKDRRFLKIDPLTRCFTIYIKSTLERSHTPIITSCEENAIVCEE